MSSRTSISSAQNRRTAPAPPPPQSYQKQSRGIPTQQPPQYAQQQPPQYAQQPPPQYAQQQPQYAQQQPQQQPPQQNKLPFTKLTVSDAIGLITLRLGRVEQFMMEFDENNVKGGGEDSGSNNILLTNIIGKIETQEKDSLEKINNMNNKINKLEKDLRETKDLLMSILLKIEVQNKSIDEKITSSLDKYYKEVHFGFENIYNETLYNESSIQPIVEEDEPDEEPENRLLLGY